eukprot:g2689.t1
MVKKKKRSRAKEEREVSALRSTTVFEYEPLVVSEEDRDDESSSDDESHGDGSYPIMYNFENPFDIEPFETERLKRDYRLYMADDSRAMRSKSSEKHAEPDELANENEVLYRELASSGHFVRVHLHDSVTGAYGQFDGDEINDGTDDVGAEELRQDFTQKYFLYVYTCLISTGQGLLAGLSLALLLLFDRYETENASFISFYVPWAGNLHLVHHILQSLFCCDVLNILFFRCRISGDEYFVRTVEEDGASKDAVIRTRWQRTRVIDLWILGALLVLQGTSLLLSTIMGKMDCVMSVSDLKTVEQWQSWIDDGGQDIFDTWKEAAWARAVFLVVGWLLYNIVVESQRYMDERFLRKWMMRDSHRRKDQNDDDRAEGSATAASRHENEHRGDAVAVPLATAAIPEVYGTSDLRRRGRASGS